MDLDGLLEALERLVDEAQEALDDDPGEGNIQCEGCRACYNCRFCELCDSCEDCTYCEGCVDCLSCTQSKRCVSCERSAYLEDCRECEGSRYLVLCVNCKDCTHCLGCAGLEGAEYCVLNEKVGKKRFNQILKQVRAELERRAAAGWRPELIGLISEVEDEPESDDEMEDEAEDEPNAGPRPRPIEDEASPWRDGGDSPWLEGTGRERSRGPQHAATPTRGSLGAPSRPPGRERERDAGGPDPSASTRSLSRSEPRIEGSTRGGVEPRGSARERKVSSEDSSPWADPAGGRRDGSSSHERDGSSFVESRRRYGLRSDGGTGTGTGTGTGSADADLRARRAARRTPDFSAHLPQTPSRPRDLEDRSSRRTDDAGREFADPDLRRGARPADRNRLPPPESARSPWIEEALGAWEDEKTPPPPPPWQGSHWRGGEGSSTGTGSSANVSEGSSSARLGRLERLIIDDSGAKPLTFDPHGRELGAPTPAEDDAVGGRPGNSREPSGSGSGPNFAPRRAAPRTEQDARFGWSPTGSGSDAGSASEAEARSPERAEGARDGGFKDRWSSELEDEDRAGSGSVSGSGSGRRPGSGPLQRARPSAGRERESGADLGRDASRVPPVEREAADRSASNPDASGVLMRGRRPPRRRG